LRLCFSRVDITLFLAGRHKALSRAVVKVCLSCGQLFRLCFLWAVVKVCLLQAVKVWPLHGPNPPKFHLYARDNRQTDRRQSNEKSEAWAFGCVGVISENAEGR
jgi:hypothetical protein